MISIPGKIPITIHPLFWLVAFFIGWVWTVSLTGALICLIVIIFSVLFHEYGHALTAIAFGQKTRIELAAFGGFTYRQGRKLKLWEEFLVVLNGPVAGLLLSGIAFMIWKYVPITHKPLHFLVQFTFVANLFWTIMNLVPVLPLDGGHLLSIILESIFGFKGVKMAIVIGLVIAIAISIFFFAIGQFLIGALFLILTFESFRSLRYYKIFSEKDRDTDLQELLKSADKDFQDENYDRALAKLEEVRSRTKEGILYTVATQEIAEIYKKQERYEEAYALLKTVEGSLTNENMALFHSVAFANNDYAAVTKIGDQCYQNSPTPETALVNGLSYGALGKAEPAVGWLECAIREGLQNVDEIIKREELDPIRNDPTFLEFLENYTKK